MSRAAKRPQLLPPWAPSQAPRRHTAGRPCTPQMGGVHPPTPAPDQDPYHSRAAKPLPASIQAASAVQRPTNRVPPADEERSCFIQSKETWVLLELQVGCLEEDFPSRQPRSEATVSIHSMMLRREPLSIRAAPGPATVQSELYRVPRSTPRLSLSGLAKLLAVGIEQIGDLLDADVVCGPADQNGVGGEELGDVLGEDRGHTPDPPEPCTSCWPRKHFCLRGFRRQISAVVDPLPGQPDDHRACRGTNDVRQSLDSGEHCHMCKSAREPPAADEIEAISLAALRLALRVICCLSGLAGW